LGRFSISNALSETAAPVETAALMEPPEQTPLLSEGRNLSVNFK
jgi:hypothetical protein